MKLKYFLSTLLIEKIIAEPQTIEEQELELAQSADTDLFSIEQEDLDYPQPLLDELEQNGIDTSTYPKAYSMEGTEDRAVMQYNYLWHEKTDDGRIAVPFSFHKNFPKKYQFKQWLENMSADLGCLQLVYVPEAELLTTQYKYGILITNTDDTPDDSWCKSTFGIVPGYTSSNGAVTNFGAKSTWQLLLMADGCMKEGTAHHEMMHALGFKHEHVRPDRDTYLTVDHDYLQEYKSSSYHNFVRLDHWLWQDSDHSFELRSVMNYNGRAYMTTKSGEYWVSNRMRLTSTDALQIQWLYCISHPEIGKTYQYTDSTDCGSADAIGLSHKVLKSRVCDGIRDCNGGEDEDGTLETCPAPVEKTDSGCCKYVVVTDQEQRYNCVAKGATNGRDQWECTVAETGIRTYELFWQPKLWGTEGAGTRAGWVFGYQSCAKNYGSCDKGHHLTDQTCPPEGGYGINPSYNYKILNTGFLTNVYCSRGETFHTVNQYEKNTKKNIKNLKDDVEASSHVEKVKTRMMRVVNALVHISGKRVRKCARGSNYRFHNVREASIVPFSIGGPSSGMNTSNPDLIAAIGEACNTYDAYLNWRHNADDCGEIEIFRLSRLRRRCEAYRRHRLNFEWLNNNE